MPIRPDCVAVLTLSLALIVTGCSSSKDVAVNTYESARGTTYGLIDAEPDETLDAVKAATAEYHVTIYDVDPTQDPAGYTVRAEEEDGRNIKITITQHAPGVTRLAVRVGFFGDSAKNDILYERIAERLGLEPKPAD